MTPLLTTRGLCIAMPRACEGFNSVAANQVGDGAGEFDGAMVAARRKFERAGGAD